MLNVATPLLVRPTRLYSGKTDYWYVGDHAGSREDAHRRLRPSTPLRNAERSPRVRREAQQLALSEDHHRGGDLTYAFRPALRHPRRESKAKRRLPRLLPTATTTRAANASLEADSATEDEE
ncbi:hypothetical protein AAVH_42591 [Aphelenchoides avenae]|nr:hypothetical protein AAVH_42591 [Aphelenchus avenae]